jgi:hypothetical protein
MPANNAQHQAARRSRLRQAGKRPITVVVDDSTADTLRWLAKEHGKNQGEVIALGLLLAHQRLTLPSTQAPATSPAPPKAHTEPLQQRRAESRAIAPVQAEQVADAQAESPAGAAEPWWPENFRELLARD